MTQKTWMRVEALLPRAEAEQVMALIRSFGVRGGTWSVDEGRGGLDQRPSDPAQMAWEPLGEPCPECRHFAPDHAIGCTLAPADFVAAPDPRESAEVQAALELVRQVRESSTTGTVRPAAPRPGQKPTRRPRRR